MSSKPRSRNSLAALPQILGRHVGAENGRLSHPAMILGTLAQLHMLAPELNPPQELTKDGYWIKSARVRGFRCIIVAGASDRGVLYGVFALLSKIARAEDIDSIDEVQQPYAPIRWVNQWDNLDGTHRTRIRRTLAFLCRRKSSRRPDSRRRSTRGCWLRSGSTAAPSTT